MKELQWITSYSFKYPKDSESENAGIYTVNRNIHKKQSGDEIVYEYETALIDSKTEWEKYEKQKDLDRLNKITFDIARGEHKKDTMGYSAFGYMLADKIDNGEYFLGSCPDDMKEEVEKILHEYHEGLQPINNQSK